MAMDGVGNFQSRKRKRISRKLQVDENVEVRSLEVGFLGSWHPGIVIQCEKLKRHVRYKNVLDDDGVDYLVEELGVSKALDGDIEHANCYERGFIRPVPPLVDFERGDLRFGLCVDVSHQEAWWEGVIFDHCDGMEKRSVFFPDLGDEMQVGINHLRITQDWDEVTEEWEQRGNWVFLEMVEKWERKLFVAVSAKQIWYDVRLKREFETIREWTCNVKYLWVDVVKEVVNDYLSLTVKEVLSVLNLPGSLLNEAPELESVEAMASVLSMTLPDNEIVVQKEPVPPVKAILPKFQKEINPYGACEVVSGASCFEGSREHRSSTPLRSNYWKPVMLSEVELCPDAVREYPLASKRATKAFWKEKLQKHLVYLGWKIEWSNRLDIKRYRYNVPDKQGQKVYLSLIEVCKVMEKDPNMNSLQFQNDQSIMHPTVDCHLSDVPLNPSENIQNPDIFPPTVPSSPVEDEVEDVPEFCPQAVVHYYHLHISNKNRVAKKKWILKAKKHLLAEGWIFDHPPPTNKKRGIIYMSPQNRKFPTLHAACKFCIDASIPKWAMSDMQSGMNEENVDQVWNGELVCKLSRQDMDGGAASRSTANRRRKSLRDSKANIPKCQSNGLSLQVLRSNKRVQKVSAHSPLHHKPLNVLSWLIDSNVILPRSKVYYKVKGRYRKVRNLADGKITRDGIKCNCCLSVYNFVGFGKHAGGRRTCKPSASIFLEDGRSLLDCQIQMMQDQKTRETSEKSFSGLSLAENDYICSVCHYGGELILCDKCPSSFHKMCLGLEDIPDGDWFCPSCRCGICGQRKIDGDDEVGHFLTCVQCEHKYHVRCLKNGAVDISRYLGNWFCGKDCQKIYEGLHKLLGEPVSVGADNLTWTLVKFINPDSCDLSSIKSDLLAESYSKLNLALLVMHECFEPLNESFTSRDLVEDVIFSRWSELNRLNFQGFYTVLLERNEELISVATIRVYGKKVAEVPLVGTRLQYRRHGMCRILINELEKKLTQLGVERLVLPAVPSVLETWTSSFGFAKMTNFERSQFLDYTFLDFQGTIMCQKLLMNIPSPDSVFLTEAQPKCDVFSGSCGVNFSKSSQACEVYRVEEIDEEEMVDQQTKHPVCEVYRVEEIDEGEMVDQQTKDPVCEVYRVEGIDEGGMVDQQMEDTCAGNDDNVIGADPFTMVEQGDQQCQNGTTSSQCSTDKQIDRNNDPYKFFYRRRKVRKTCV